MRFEQSVEIDARQQRVWDVLTDLESWPRRIETVELVELLTPAPMAVGSRVRLRQPRLGEGTWEVTVWEPPAFFEFHQTTGGISTVAGHRVEVLGEARSRLSLTLDMRGLLVPIFGRIYRDLTNRYLTTEAQSLKRAAEAP
ncbi:MAG TPA: SRPBCC family protein [Candidatus Limnocylindria bacterium]